jgi:glycosyl transferase family 25
MPPPRTAVRVISLESALTRRHLFSRDAEATATPWQFFPAYTAPTPPLRYDDHKARRRFGRPLSPTEVACYVSHYKVWEWLAASNYDQALIFEDDVRIDWPAIEELTKYDFAPRALHLIHLFATHGFNAKTVIHRFLSPHHHLLRIQGPHLGAQGYLLTRHGAAQLCKTANPIYMPCDWYTARYWQHGLPSYILFPFPIIETFVPSMIGDNRADTPYYPSRTDRIERLYWRTRDRAARAWADQFHLNKNRFPKTHDIGESFLRASRRELPTSHH